MAKNLYVGVCIIKSKNMKMLIIGFLALAYMGTNNVNKEHYLDNTKMILEPMDHQRRIGKIDLYKLTDKEFNKEFHVSKSISATPISIDFDSLMISRFFNVSEINSIEDKKVLSNLSNHTEGPGGKEEVVDKLFWFFDIYGISGGIVAIILLFTGIRFFSKGQ